ncbi:DUF3137 domain-containing protein [Nocardioides sp. CER19]|uniref:DUF3137 domain-containing protein n=1 Tax=Nocardioides sp. CER19 TaxID=3038538 RepID=UPI0024499C42|nr:DUF3137 domain-containing protein [Nocardioides sp. CER19]MDH2415817.1 DUF3137 domain-containing protein [Nocardioides sp. CER19]
MSAALPLIIVVGLALVALIAVASYLSAKRRREAIAALVAAKGWTHTERDDRWTEVFDGAPFGRGHDRQARDVIQGAIGQRRWVTFDYVYHTTETSTDGQGHTSTREQSHRFAVMAVDVGAAFPRLSVSPEGVVGRFFGRLTGRDIELESEDFNRAFTVNADDRKFASDVLHPQMMEYLLGHRDLEWRSTGHWVVSAEPGSNELTTIETRAGVLAGILDRVPEFVWRDLRGTA